jgi:hypothetical protein
MAMPNRSLAVAADSPHMAVPGEDQDLPANPTEVVMLGDVGLVFLPR